MKQIGKIKFLSFIFGIFLFMLPLLATAASQEEDEKSVEFLKNKFKTGTLLLRKIDTSLKNQEDLLSDTNEDVREVKKRLTNTAKKVGTLKDQLLNLQNVMLTSQKKLLTLKRQIAERENELLLLREEIAVKRSEKQQLFEHIQILTRFPSQQPLADGGFASLSVLLAFEDLGQGLTQDYFSEMLRDYTMQLLQEADRTERELGLAARQLKDKKQTLQYLQERQEAEIRNVSVHQEAKKNILSLTKGQETIYEELLEASKKEQEEIGSIIKHLRENYAFVQIKLDELRKEENLSREISLDDFEEALQQMPFDLKTPFRWPVPPHRGISAYFQDAPYRKAMGIPHNAVDIRVIQETKVRAAASGVIYKVRDEDTGYNYVILAHRDGYLTLYGHLTQIDVKEGETILSGETIGLSGGIPGTRGAGWLTTGAHLHFEVFKDWKHVDPLEYLPLEFLPIEYVPQKYLSKFGDFDAKIPREPKRKVKRIPTDI